MTGAPPRHPAAMRRGACPSLSQPMRTGDGLLVRLRPASGAFSPVQLSGLAEAAARRGNGIVEITARGNLQIRGLSAASADGLAGDVAALAIAPRTGVPVETGPLAGLDPEALADPTLLASMIRDGARDKGLGARLGAKVTVVADGGGRLGLRGLLADIRLDAVRQPAGVRWRVSLAGTGESAVPLRVLGMAQAAGMGVSLLEAIASKGPAARGRDLLPEGSKPGLPALGEASAGRMHGQGPDTSGNGRFRPSLPAASGRAAVEASGSDIFVGMLKLGEGDAAFVAALPFGQITAAELTAFASQAESCGATQFRLAPERRVLALGLDEAGCAKLGDLVRALGLIVDPADARLGIVACAGAPACASAFLETKALAAELARNRSGAGGLHVSGCAKGCAEPTGRLPAIVGTSGDAVEIRVGATTSRVVLGEIPAALGLLLGQGSGGKRGPVGPAQAGAAA